MGQEKKEDSSSVVGITSGIGGAFVVKPKIEESSSMIAQGFATKPRSKPWKFKSSSRSGGIDRSKIKCGHFGKMRHSKEECFQLIDFPKGWKSQRKDKTTSGTVATTIAGSEDDGNGDRERITSSNEKGIRSMMGRTFDLNKSRATGATAARWYRLPGLRKLVEEEEDDAALFTAFSRAIVAGFGILCVFL